jgi:uncharacterized membrane protein
MKIIIGIILIYIILVVSSASLMRYIWNTGHKGTELEETWTKSLKTFAIGYFIVRIILMMIFSIFHFCF